MTILQIFD